jgi:hypothetical protein
VLENFIEIPAIGNTCITVSYNNVQINELKGQSKPLAGQIGRVYRVGFAALNVAGIVG